MELKTPPVHEKPSPNASPIDQQNAEFSCCGRKLCQWIPSNFWEEVKKILLLAGPLVRVTVAANLYAKEEILIWVRLYETNLILWPLSFALSFEICLYQLTCDLFLLSADFQSIILGRTITR